MPNLLSKNIESILAEVNNLKDKFKSEYQNPGFNSALYIKSMRILYGRAIYEKTKILDKIVTKNGSISDDDALLLSSNECLVYAIHLNIEFCEKLKYEDNKSYTLQNSDTYTDTKPVTVINRTNPTGTEELSIQQPNLLTDLPMPDNNLDNQFKLGTKLPQSNFNKITSQPINTDNLSDFINNLNTDDNPILTEGQLGQLNPVAQTGGDNNIQSFVSNDYKVDNPTLVNFWANWCGFSKKFQNKWEEFKSKAAELYPNLQVTELDVGRDPALAEIAKQNGVKGYPTLVLLNNGKIKTQVAGNMQTADIYKFIKSNM